MSPSSKYVLPVFFITLLLGTVILGPLIYFLMGVIWPIPFHRAMDRALLISALGAILLSASRISWGKLWPLNGDSWKQILLGLLIAVVSIQAMIGADLALAGFGSAHLSAGAAWGRVLLAAVAALLAAPIEETIFRGFLQRELIQGLGWRAGWILAAVIFMLAHFLKIPVELDKSPVHLWSGATALGAAFSHFGHDLLIPENMAKAANLLLVGLILGGIYLRADSLWLNAGLHGGWIFGLLLFTGFTKPDEPPYIPFFGGDILSTPGTTVVLVLVGIWLWRFYRHPSILPETGPSAP